MLISHKRYAQAPLTSVAVIRKRKPMVLVPTSVHRKCLPEGPALPSLERMDRTASTPPTARKRTHSIFVVPQRRQSSHLLSTHCRATAASSSSHQILKAILNVY